MAFADELLGVAKELVELNRVPLEQASLRRAVSTAYYALFHLLAGEATANWNRAELRPLLGRVFEHGKMKQACSKVADWNLNIPSFEDRSTGDHLRVVARAFIQAQERRENADYDVALLWSRGDVEALIQEIVDAFRSWNAIRNQPDAQELLVMFLGPKQRNKNG